MPNEPMEPPDAPSRHELTRPREIAVDHQGVRVFHAYKHNCIDNGPLSFWYTLDPEGDLEFDIRQLDAWTAVQDELQQPVNDSPKSVPHDRVLRRAVETGALRTPEQAGTAGTMNETCLYDYDFAAWARHQAQLVTEGRWEELDRDNVAEELRSIASQESQELRRILYQLFKRLLRWYYKPEWRCGRWKSRIVKRRFHLRDLLERSPGLDTSDAIASQWQLAAKYAEIQLRLSTPPPSECPYTLEQLLDLDYYPN
jgi:hypothetical protein